jgi:hypothetical protein
MNNQSTAIFVLCILAICLVAFIVFYNKKLAGKPLLGMHIQASGCALGLLGGLLGFVFHEIQFGAICIFGGFILGLIGLSIHTKNNSGE